MVVYSQVPCELSEQECSAQAWLGHEHVTQHMSDSLGKIKGGGGSW